MEADPMKPYLIISYLILCVAVGATADGLYFRGFTTIHGYGEALEIGLALIAAPLSRITLRQLFAFVATYICMRIVAFDYIHNLVAGLDLFYLGESKLWDRFLSQFPPHGITFMRAVFLVLGMSLPFKYLKI
jgi:hypothetical protein